MDMIALDGPMIASHVGEVAEFMRQSLPGERARAFYPQAMLAELMATGGSGRPGFYGRTGIGAVVVDSKKTMVLNVEV